MSVPCEVAVKCVLPVVRAMIAKELLTAHHMKQVQVAELLRVSQPAISLYRRRIRGKAIDLGKEQDAKSLILEIAAALAQNSLTYTELVDAYCKVCSIIRAKGLLCGLHRTFDTKIDLENCSLCKSTKTSTGPRCP